MTVFTEGRHAAEFLVSEANGYASRQAIVVASGADLEPGTVMGKTAGASATSAVKASGANTGNATMSAITVSAGVKLGLYTVRMLTATTFRVEDPEGFVIGDGATGAAFLDDIGFTMTVGGTPMVAGDGFDITVIAAVAKYKALNLAGTDGSQIASAVLRGHAYAADADVNAVAFVRQCEVNGGELEWPSGITTNQKAAATVQLAAAGIIVR